MIDLTQYGSFFANSYFGNTVQSYTYFIALLLIISLFLKLFQVYVISALKRFSEKTATKIDDAFVLMISSVRWPFYLVVSIFVSSKILMLNSFINKSIYYLTVLVIVYYAVKAIGKLIDFVTTEKIKSASEEQRRKEESMLNILNKIAKSALWVVAILLLLSNFGVEITPLIASLGVGGIAIAFAMQNILEDLFSSFSIYFDKPFEVGDFIIIGTDMGVVKYVGLKSTRLSTLQGQELIVSNRELTNTRINNYKRMEKRRIVFAFGVEYSTNLKKIKRINEIVRKIVKDIKLTTLDRVHFKEFGDFSLNFEVVYYLDSSDYNVYMDTQQEINYKLKEAFEKEKIEFAFPTQTLFLKK